MIEEYGMDNPCVKGYLSAKNNPLFGGKMVNYFDAIIQGHVHWKIYEHAPSMDFYSIRALGMAYDAEPINTASYVILTEKDNGFDFEEVLVEFDRDKMEQSILKSDSPDHTIKKFVKMKMM